MRFQTYRVESGAVNQSINGLDPRNAALRVAVQSPHGLATVASVTGADGVTLYFLTEALAREVEELIEGVERGTTVDD